MTYFPTPTGDPATLRTVAAAQRSVASGSQTSAADLRREGGSMTDVWEGDSSLTAVGSLNGLATLVDDLDGAAGRAAAGIDSYADALETYQEAVADLNERHATALARYRLRPSPPTTPEELTEAQDEQWVFDETVRTLWSEYHTAGGTHEDAARALLTTVETDLPPHIRDHAQSLGDWTTEIITEIADQVPVLGEFVVLGFEAREISEGAAALIDGASLSKRLLDVMRGTTTSHTGGLLGSLLDNALNANRDPSWLNRWLGLPKLPWYQAFLDGDTAALRAGAPSWLANGRLSTFLMGTQAEVGVASRTQSIAALMRGNSLTTGLGHVGLLRGLGLVGSVAGTGLAAVNVISQGNPIEAFKENGAEYVQDVAELGFNASMTAMLIAPNPVTIGATAVTGLIYGGLALVNNWDDVTAAVGEAWDATSEFVGGAVDAVEDFASDAVDAVGDFAGDVVDNVGNAFSALNPFD